jgi:sugar fermentation stimulation protein A
LIAPLARRPRAARFVARPHRFAALVRLRGGAVVEAHLPNPGRLTGTLSENCRVWVEGPFPPPRMLPYSLLAAQEGPTIVGAVPAHANRVFPVPWRDGLFPEVTAAVLRACH